MTRYKKFENEIFAELRHQGINLSDRLLRHPVVDGKYVGPNYATREALKYGFLKAPNERLRNMVAAWVYFCTTLWCAEVNRHNYTSFANYLRSESCKTSFASFAERIGVKELMSAA